MVPPTIIDVIKGDHVDELVNDFENFNNYLEANFGELEDGNE